MYNLISVINGFKGSQYNRKRPWAASRTAREDRVRNVVLYRGLPRLTVKVRESKRRTRLAGQCQTARTDGKPNDTVGANLMGSGSEGKQAHHL